MDNNLEKEGSLLYRKASPGEDPAQELIDEYKLLNNGQDLFEQNASDQISAKSGQTQLQNDLTPPSKCQTMSTEIHERQKEMITSTGDVTS